MKNRGVNLGYLIVFDSRKRDFNTGIPKVTVVEKGLIKSLVIDVRSEVK